MAIKFIEPIIIAVKSDLNTNLGAKLDVIDTEKGDFVLRDIAEYYECEKAILTQFPACEIVALDSPGEDFTTGSVKCDHKIGVIITEVDEDEERLTKRIFRYLRAITEVLKDDSTLGGNCDLCLFDGHSYSPLGREQKSYIKSGVVFFIVDQEEAIG